MMCSRRFITKTLLLPPLLRKTVDHAGKKRLGYVAQTTADVMNGKRYVWKLEAACSTDVLTSLLFSELSHKQVFDGRYRV